MNAPTGSLRAGPDANGHFGEFGGRYVAETLMPLVLELEQAYIAAKADPAFQAELDDLLDEIDDVLEANAEDFVKSYIQKGGE